MIHPRTLGIHNGSFHADEVTATALLLLYDLIDQNKVVRTRDLRELDSCEYVCDVGGIYDPSQKRFDHHQVDYQGPLSSAGMVLLYLKDQKILDTHLFDMYNRMLIQGVDAHDNGLARIEAGTTSFSQVISNFLPVRYDAKDEEMDAAFFEAVHFVMEHLDRMRERYVYTVECQNIVRNAMKDTGCALVFNESIPWVENFFDLGGELHPAQFVIMPSGGNWKLRGIPPSAHERMKVRRLLPESWAGLLEEELKKVSGIQGAIFCHKGRFISIWETKEDAMRALRLVESMR